MAVCYYARAADLATKIRGSHETHQPPKAFISLYFIVGAAGLGAAIMLACFLFKTIPIQTRLRWSNNVRRRLGLREISEVVETGPEIGERHPRPVESDKVVSPDNLSIMFPQQELVPSDSDTEPKTCCICLEVIPVGSSIRILDCGHLFHSSCIASWLTKYRRQCPLCNHVIPRDSTNLARSSDLQSEGPRSPDQQPVHSDPQEAPPEPAHLPPC